MSAEYEALAYIYNTLSDDINLQTLQVALRPTHHAGLEDPTYPLITYEVIHNQDDRALQCVHIEIQVWSERGTTEKWEIFGRVKQALVHKAGATENAHIVTTRQLLVDGSGDEPEHRLYRVVGRFLVEIIER